MLKKLLVKCLDNYYSTKFTEYILKQIRLRHFLDVRINEYKNGMIDICAKPSHYNTYTRLFGFHKGDSLNHLVSLRDIETNQILKLIKELNKNDSWEKEGEE